MARQDRRTLIADAGRAILADTGSRGLTHLAVDRSLGWPKGSTSYYHRTRAALIEAVAARMVEVDLQDASQRMSAHRGPPAVVAEGLARLVTAYSSGEGRSRTVARYELFLLATREESLSRRLADFRLEFIRLGQSLLSSEETEASWAAAAASVAFVEGLLLNNIRLPGPVLPEDEVAQLLCSVIERYLEA